MEHSSEKPASRIRYPFKKEERLCSKKMIDKLFAEGTSFLIYPFKVLYTEADFPGEHRAKAAFAVSKKRFKKAVSRNLIKRRMREAYRLNKHRLQDKPVPPKRTLIFIYIGKDILPYSAVEKAMVRTIQLLKKSPSQHP